LTTSEPVCEYRQPVAIGLYQTKAAPNPRAAATARGERLGRLTLEGIQR
jgi:hypothetical protein